MYSDIYCYKTEGEIIVSRSASKTSIDIAIQELLLRLDFQRGGLFKSNYEYPGRYKRWAIGFVNPPLELATCGNNFTLTALNERGILLLEYLAKRLYRLPQLQEVKVETNRVTGSVHATESFFSEEERSKQPSVFSIVREIIKAFSSPEDSHLGLYGAFGYDLVFQFEQMPKHFQRAEDQKDLVLYLPDELLIVDYYQQSAFHLQYEFVTQNGTTKNLPRDGQTIDYRGKRLTYTNASDHAPGEYEQQVEKALSYFQRGDLFEVVPS